MATTNARRPSVRRIPPQGADQRNAATSTIDGDLTTTLAATPACAPILAIEELSAICRGLREAGKRIVQCHGAFDLLHPGHIKHFQAAKVMGEVLVVTVTADRFIRKGPGRPAFNQQLRADSIAALRVVDFVGIADWPTGVEAIEHVRPHFYVKGQDYADRSKDVSGVIAAEEAAAQRCGGKLVFTHEVQFSSTKLIGQHFTVFTDE